MEQLYHAAFFYVKRRAAKNWHKRRRCNRHVRIILKGKGARPVTNPFDFVLWILELAGESDANEILSMLSGLWG